MTLPQFLNYDDLQQVYMLANTPRYLLKHFIRMEGVRELAASNSFDELVRLLRISIADAQRGLDDVLSIYALLAALSLSENETDKGPLLSELEESDMEWLMPLAHLCLHRIRSTNLVRLDGHFTYTPDRGKTSETSRCYQVVCDTPIERRTK